MLNELAPSGAFVLRTPLLPVDVLAGWGVGDDDARGRLRELSARPEVAEALQLASPGLAARWRAFVAAEPLGQRSLTSIERAVGAYLVRMATRPTPFGLFAGVATGVVGDTTSLDVPPLKAHRRRSRLDTGVLASLAESVEREPGRRGALRFVPSTGLYRAGGSMRVIEARTAGGVRSHHLIALDEDEALASTLARAHRGATVDELAAPLIGDGVSLDDAEAYVGELVESGILVSDLQPAITGGDPVPAMVDVLRRSPSTEKLATALAEAASRLAEVDSTGLGGDHAGEYADVIQAAEELVPDVDAARVVQVELFEPGTPTLGREVVDELRTAIDLLHRISPVEESPLDRFRVAFEARYGTRHVPLVETLDEDAGIGFDGAGADESPLLAGVDLGPPPARDHRWTARDDVLLDLLGRTVAAGSGELALTDSDVERLSNPSPPPLPDALTAMATVVGGRGDVERGRFRVLMHAASGPSGAQLLGRFCDGDADLEAAVRALVDAEERHVPDAIYAEVVHLPEGRIGNIIRRPVLREWELPFLGRSGAPEDRQLSITDLTVAVDGERVVLRSVTHGREVLPRLATAHNTERRNLGLYRFLTALQYQGVASGLAWGWGALGSAPFLPRVTRGQIVLSRARWRLREDELEALTGPAALRTLAAARRMPRFVAVADGDNELRVDLDSDASIEIALTTLSGRTSATLVEVLPSPEELCATGPAGTFTHEVLVPFVRAVVGERPRAAAPRTAALVRRRLPPGSEWLYVKAYAGVGALDRVVDAVAPVLAEDRWFFVRYADPDWHLRVRVCGDPTRLLDDVQPRLLAALDPLVDAGAVWRTQLDTYEREVERYGGDEGMELAEDVFAADSETVAGIVALLSGDAGLDARWRLALAGTDRLLDDLGLDLAAKSALARRRRDGFAVEFPGGKAQARQLGQRFRAERAALEQLLREPGPDHPLEPGLAHLRQRSERLASVTSRLRLSADGSRLGVSVESWAASVAHMHANRLLRSAHRAQELVIWDLLDRLYRSRLARSQAFTGATGDDR